MDVFNSKALWGRATIMNATAGQAVSIINGESANRELNHPK